MNEPAFDDCGEFIHRNNFADADFDVYSDVGPSSSSKRAKILQDIQGFLQYTQNDPELMRIMTLFAMKNMEGDEVDVLRKFADKKFMQMGGREPTKEEQAEAAKAAENAPPDANHELLMAESRKSDAQAEKADAETIETYANIEKIQAETAETYSGIDRDDLSSGIAAANAINQVASAPPQQPRTGEQ